jgi:tetratricopeptide (TPR) repeat protein
MSSSLRHLISMSATAQCGNTRTIWLTLVFLCVACIATVSFAATPGEMERALLAGRVDEVTQGLQGAPRSDAAAQLLLCRAWYAQAAVDAAVASCEAAAAADPSGSGGSMAQMWLGRAYGLRASHSGAITAYQVAKRVRAAFERSVSLDPDNLAAVNDLGHFYAEAPKFLGGGTDKARALAEQVMPRSAVLGHHLLGLAAEEDGDARAAEAEFQQAARSQTPDAEIDLAVFYQRQKNYDQAEATVRRAIALDTRHGPALVDAAGILVSIKRDLALAERCLVNYITSPAKTDEAPAFRAEVQLGKLLARRGDTTGAQREFSAALSMASNYAPARKAAEL